MLIHELIEQSLNFPLHLTKGIANVAAFPVRAILHTDYLPDTAKPDNGESTVYDITKPMLDIASIIYYYTELRSATKKRLEKYAEKLNLTLKNLEVVGNDDIQHSKDRLNIEVIRNAIQHSKDTRLKWFKATDEVGASVPDALAREYKNSMQGIEDIKVRYNEENPGYNLTDGDIEVLETYFHILEQRKNVADIKSDIVLYNTYISSVFRVGFGGKDFNVRSILDMVDHDREMYIHTIDDDFVTTSMDPGGFINELNSELVYAIVVSKKSKRITVVFRGSVNANDWITNIEGAMTEFKLPGYTSPETANNRQTYGRVHKGFNNYLFEKTQKGSNGSYKSKAEEIVGIIRSLLKRECEGYSVFVTGHSLGGALSTMFAVRAATFGKFPLVTNVSFASPYAGDQGFRDHFYKLEKENKIRHLRISNDEDVVPLIPPAFPAFKGWRSVPELEMYKHTGMNIRLYNQDQLLMPRCRLFYPKKGSWPNEVRNAVLNSIPAGLSVGVISKHLCPEYSSRLEDAKEELHKMTVEGLYKDEHITGWSNKAPDTNAGQ